MSIYERPRCDCGTLLIYWEEEMYEITTPITKEGNLSERGIKERRTGIDGAFSRLYCPKCLNEYDFKQDIEGRYIRNGIWDNRKGRGLGE